MSSDLPECVLVFDVGGTRLRAGLYSGRTDGLSRIVRCDAPGFKLLRDADPQRLRAELIDALDGLRGELLGQNPPDAICVAFPGPIDHAGRALAAPTIWGSTRRGAAVPVLELLRQRWPGSRVLVLNDMSAAGYCYLTHPVEDLCIVTVSSGIGEKVFVHGQPLIGSRGFGGEIGHWRVDLSEDAPRCDCGALGHLGAVASGSATSWQLGRLAEEDPRGYRESRLGERLGGRLDRQPNEELAGAFRAGDPWSVRLVRRMTRPLGQVLAAIHLAVGTERFVVGGGFALALGEGYRALLAESAAACGWDLGAAWETMIELGTAGDDAGLIGAGRFAVKQLTATRRREDRSTGHVAGRDPRR